MGAVGFLAVSAWLVPPGTKLFLQLSALSFFGRGAQDEASAARDVMVK